MIGARRPSRPKGFLVTTQQWLLAGELARRSLLLAALQASLRKDAGRLRFAVVRNHLRLHHSASYATLPDTDLRRACRELRISCTRTFVVGVRLSLPKWRAALADWCGRLEGEGLGEEPPMIPRGLVDDVPVAPENLPQPGQMYNGADGVQRQVPIVATFEHLADTRNADGTRGRPRRWTRYLHDLRAYLKRARIAPKEREILEMTVAGMSSIRIGRELKRSGVGVRWILSKHHRLGGIKGPGPGR
jgi:DNA-binding CsgD family transcriptional regulator